MSHLSEGYLPLYLCLLYVLLSQAQPVNTGNSTEKRTKPYKILTSGKQITIKSTKAIKHVMLWTTGGNRVVEQKEINNSSYTVYYSGKSKNIFPDDRIRWREDLYRENWDNRIAMRRKE